MWKIRQNEKNIRFWNIYFYSNTRIYPFILNKWFGIPISYYKAAPLWSKHEYTNSQTYSLKALCDKGQVVTDISKSVDFKKKLRFDEYH